MLPKTTESLPVDPALSWLYFLTWVKTSRTVPVHHAMSGLRVHVAKFLRCVNADLTHRIAPNCLK